MIPATQLRTRAYHKLVRNIPVVLFATFVAWWGLTKLDGKAPVLFSWVFVAICAYNVLIGALAFAVQLLDILAYFLVSDKEWSETREEDPLSADLRWKTVGLLPAILYIILWAGPGIWIFFMLWSSI